MIKDVLRSIEGVEIYPVISLLIFIIFFTSMIIWVFRLDEKLLESLKRLPLENNHIDDGEKNV